MKILKITLIGIIASLLFNSTAFAGSGEWRFMHNDHDTLVIGEMLQPFSDHFAIRVEDFIVSTGSIPPIREQLRPEIARVFDYHGWLSEFDAGDYIIAALNHIEDDMFAPAWGIYRVSSLDYRTLTVETLDPMTSAMLTDFVNSGGRYNDFAGAPTWLVRRYNGEEILIWQSDEVDIINLTENFEPEAANGRSWSFMSDGIWIAIAVVGLIIAATLGVIAYKKSKRNR